MSRKILLFVLTLLQFASCNRVGYNYWALDEVEYIQEFPSIIDLNRESGEGILPDIPGVLDVRLWQNYILISSKNENGYIYVFEKDSKEFMGQYLLHGNGPKELLFPPFFSSMHFDDRGAWLVNQKGNLLFWDINKSCSEYTTVCEYLSSLPSFTYTNGSLNYLPINETVTIGNGIDNDMRNRSRFFIINDEMFEIQAMKKLNAVCIPERDSELINILSSVYAVNSDNGMIIEASIMLNSIQLYSIDGTFAKTLCIGSTLDDVNSVWKYSPASMPVSFRSPRAYEKCFAILFADTTELEDQLLKTKKPEILVFDWVGNPLFSLKLPTRVTSFDIDWDDNKLYTVDYDNEHICVFHFDASIVQ